MKKLSGGGVNKRSRQGQIRRYVFYLLIFTVAIYIVSQIQYYYYAYYIPATPKYNQFIDQNGTFLQNSGFKILQCVTYPILQVFTDLYVYLDTQNELKLYFQLVPPRSYHVALIKLKPKHLKKKDFNMLKQEQELLDTNGTYTTCQGKQLIIIEKNEIRMQVELPSDYINNILKYLQGRWKQKFPSLISEQYTTFYITLAYQFRNIPNRDIFNQIDKGLKEWQQWPVDVELDPIEICSYSDIATYTPIIPDEINED